MKRFNRFPSIEQLEEKRLKAADLATSAIAHGPELTATANATPTASSLQMAITSRASVTAKEAEDDSESERENNDSENDNETQLSAALTATTGNQGTGTAKYKSKSEDGSAEREFTLHVSGVMTNGTSVPGMQEVRVGGVLVGSINLTNGSGKLELSSDADSDDMTLPSTFPTTIDSTTMVAVGPVNAPILTGTFATGTKSESLTALPSTNVSGSQGSVSVSGSQSSVSTSSPQASVLASSAAGELQSLASTPSISRPLTARSAETNNMIAANSPELNLLDAVHASEAQLRDSVAPAELLADDSMGQSNAADSTSLDAVFESIADDKLVQTL